MNTRRRGISRRSFLKSAALASGMLAASPLLSKRALAFPLLQEVPSVEPITILINDSPWFAGFDALVDMYVEATGNQVNLDVTPFPGMLTKSRNAVQAGVSEFDILNLNEQWYGLFYEGGLVTPIREIDPDFELDPNIIEYGYATRWDADINYSGPEGELYGLPINGNIQVYFYRKDLLEEHGLEVPQTWEEVAANAAAVHNPPDMHGFTIRTRPSDWEFQAFLHGFGTSLIDLDTETGEWFVGLDSPEAVQALETWMNLGLEYGPANIADMGQAENLALMNSGRLMQVHMVSAAAPNFQDPNQSVVVDQIGASPVPAGPAGRATMSGIWVMGIPTNLPSERQQAGLTFLQWALTKEAQLAYTQAGAIPVRQDVYEELSDDEEIGWWMGAVAESTPYIKPQPRIPEAPQCFEVIARRTVQALIGEMSAEDAMAEAAAEVYGILEEGGYEVRPLSTS
jgi:multiple sugar transport system substrate-binding protein